MAKSRRSKARSNSGTLNAQSQFTLIIYNDSQLTEAAYSSDSAATTEANTICWLSVCGLQSNSAVVSLMDRFQIHHLIAEDILNIRQRPKVEEYDHQIFVVLRLFKYENGVVDSEQISFVAMDDRLLTFEETTATCFSDVLNRLRNKQGTIRKRGEDYLLYSLMDVIIDRYLDVADRIGDELDNLEDAILENPVKENFLRLQQLRRNIITLRKNFIPVREVIQSMMRNNVDFFDEQNKVYLRDLDDHMLRAIDTLDTFRDIASSVNDLYHSLVNNKMNEVMKTLTVVSSIFIPLTFIVGIYGMNFDHMPELHCQNGYFYVMGTMAMLAVAQLYYFSRKKWF